ncbi:MAG TPA: hypothetical protein VKA19_06945, partial [Alphaproteobacteria bacterium]|nr:hypothetical protein [Alphaproteobacteria bacterium]
MTRVSSFGHTQTMISDLLRNQAQMFSDQQQVNTGKKSPDYKGIADQTVTLLGAKSVQSRLNEYTQTGKQVGSVLDIYDNSIGVLDTVTNDLKQTLTQSLANEEVYGLSESLSQGLNSAVTALNTQVSGKYIFGGTRTDAPPVTVQSASDLQALVTSSDAFQNNNQKPVAQVDEGAAMQYGITASDVAGPLMNVLKAIADFNAGPNGPIDGKLTATQKSFIQTQLGNLESARRTVLNSQVENGVRQQRLSAIQTQHETTGNVMTGLISDIEDADMAKAVTNLN